jgi:hypothetical protein
VPGANRVFGRGESAWLPRLTRGAGAPGWAGAWLLQGIGVYFQVSRNYQVLEEILTAKSNKSKKEEKKGEERKHLFPSFTYSTYSTLW